MKQPVESPCDADAEPLHAAPERVPVVRLASLPARELEQRAVAIARDVQERGDAGAAVDAYPMAARLGGGSAPLHEIPSWGVRIATSRAVDVTAALREQAPPIVARVEDDCVLLDLRCVGLDEDEHLTRAIVAALAASAR